MHKKELIRRLRRFISDKKYQPRNGEKPLAEYFVYYFSQLDILPDEICSDFGIKDCLPVLLIAAFEQLCLSDDPRVVEYRDAYQREVKTGVSNLTDLNISYGVARCLDIATIESLIRIILDGDLRADMVASRFRDYCFAQHRVIQQTFDKFARLVYWRGMFQLQKSCGFAAMIGKFGDVELRLSYVTIGRFSLTFSKKINPTKRKYYTIGNRRICNTVEVSFVSECDDPLLLSARMQSSDADFRTSLGLIEEVIKNWPEDAKAQKKIFRVNKKIGMI